MFSYTGPSAMSYDDIKSIMRSAHSLDESVNFTKFKPM